MFKKKSTPDGFSKSLKENTSTYVEEVYKINSQPTEF